MTEESSIGVRKAEDKRLVADISVARIPDEYKHLLNSAKNALQAIHLQPLQLERIQEALDHAVNRTAPGDEQAGPRRIRLRIWTLGPYVTGGGWGYFILEKGDDARSPAGAAEHLLEMFLYQECDA